MIDSSCLVSGLQDETTFQRRHLLVEPLFAERVLREVCVSSGWESLGWLWQCGHGLGPVVLTLFMVVIGSVSSLEKMLGGTASPLLGGMALSASASLGKLSASGGW